MRTVIAFLLGILVGGPLGLMISFALWERLNDKI